MNYYIADTHFGHYNIILLDGRPFSCSREMEDIIVQNWNKEVRDNDTVYILGDFCWIKDEKEWIRILDKLNGNKVLLRGNHDIKRMGQKLRSKFEIIAERLEINDGKYKILLSHYPELMYNGSFRDNVYMFCGHIHVGIEDILFNEFVKKIKEYPNGPKGNIMNVGCMKEYMNFTPRTAEYIIEQHYKIYNQRK